MGGGVLKWLEDWTSFGDLLLCWRAVMDGACDHGAHLFQDLSSSSFAPAPRALSIIIDVPFANPSKRVLFSAWGLKNCIPPSHWERWSIPGVGSDTLEVNGHLGFWELVIETKPSARLEFQHRWIGRLEDSIHLPFLKLQEPSTRKASSSWVRLEYHWNPPPRFFFFPMY